MRGLLAQERAQALGAGVVHAARVLHRIEHRLYRLALAGDARLGALGHDLPDRLAGVVQRHPDIGVDQCVDGLVSLADRLPGCGS